MTELILISWLAGVSVFTAVTVDAENEALMQSNEDKALVELSQAMPQAEQTVAAIDAELDSESMVAKK